MEFNSLSQPHNRVKAVARDLFIEPLSWSQVVPGTVASELIPCELEIGSGKGLFLQSAATLQPDHFFIGIELAAKFANMAATRLAKHEFKNVAMLRGDAQRFLADVVPDNSLIAVHVYFPDPWWRNKHKKRRVLNEQALQDIQRVLASGGKLHFWTDVLDYYEHICSQLMDMTSLDGPMYVPQRTAQHSMDYTTHFERRARTHGQPVYRAIFIKSHALPSAAG